MPIAVVTRTAPDTESFAHFRSISLAGYRRFITARHQRSRRFADDLRFEFRRQTRLASYAPGLLKSGNAGIPESIFPLVYDLSADPAALRSIGLTAAFGTQQNYPRPPHATPRHATARRKPGLHYLLQRCALLSIDAQNIDLQARVSTKELPVRLWTDRENSAN